MRQVNIHEAKTTLSRLLEAVSEGEDVIISNAGRPVARLVPIAPAGRHLGMDKGLVRIAPDFDAPLPAEVIAQFER